MKQYLMPIFAAVLGVATPPLAWAVVQGSLGTTSTLQVDVQVEIGRLMRIFNLNSLSLGTFNFSQSQLQGQESFCVYDNGAAVGGLTYNITFSSANSPNTFVLSSAGQPIIYQVEFDDSQSGANFRTVTPGVALTGNVNASPSSVSCISVGGDNGTVRITVPRANAAQAPSNTYTDTLTLLVAPDP